MDACPDTDAILAFAQGVLDASERERVAEHVDGCRECSALVLEAARALATEGSVDEEAAPSITRPRLLPRGTPLARYLVLDPLGQGGLGEVYAAYDPELDRKVAIKLLKPHARATKFERRLVREGRALAKVSHPNVVGVYDVGTVSDRVFIAMELVEGRTLDAWIAAAPRTWVQLRDVLLGAAAGLHEAHRCGLVHRDFKPSNVIVTHGERAKVLDFGLARAAGDDEPATSSSDLPVPNAAEEPATKTGARVGTPAYMAPEQIVGAVVDARADQFSFCVTLYEALYGARPFAGASLPELYLAMEDGRFADATIDRRVPAWLRRVLVKGLALDPSQRYASVAQLADALSHDRRAWRRPWLAIAGAAALATAGFLALRDPASTSSERVESLTHEARAAAAKSYYVYPPPDDAEYRTANRVVVELEALSDGQERAAALRSEFADTLMRLGDRFWDREGGAPFAIDYYAQALVFDPSRELARQRATLTPGELASLRSKAATLSFTPAELAAAEPLAVLAEPDDEERKRRLAALYHSEHAPSVSTTARLERVLGAEVGEVVRTSEPRRSEPKPAPKIEIATVPVPTTPVAIAPIEEPRKKSAPTMSAAEARAAGRKAFTAGRFGEAETLLLRALELDAKDGEAAHVLAELYFERGKTAKAVELAERAVRSQPKSARHLVLLGDCLRKLGRRDDARARYEAARELGDASAEARLARLDPEGAG
jgi:tetratricopeptide (TPR) repeat protein/tRNA A-37 threonylcarbamoyl transferase component Bud32